MSDIRELTDEQFGRAIPARQRKRLVQGLFESGADVATLRDFIGLTQSEFAQAVGISVHTLRNWERQGRLATYRHTGESMVVGHPASPVQHRPQIPRPGLHPLAGQHP